MDEIEPGQPIQARQPGTQQFWPATFVGWVDGTDKKFGWVRWMTNKKEQIEVHNIQKIPLRRKRGKPQALHEDQGKIQKPRKQLKRERKGYANKPIKPISADPTFSRTKAKREDNKNDDVSAHAIQQQEMVPSTIMSTSVVLVSQKVEREDNENVSARAIKQEETVPSTVISTPVAVAPLSSQTQAVLDDIELDVKVKTEGAKANLSAEEKERLKKQTELIQKWNIDPDTGKGRYVFRRACHPSCITTVLGGSGMDPWPVTKMDNEFIKPGQIYVAGDEGWNPYGPRFPGDIGFVCTSALKFMQDAKSMQAEFHLFVQCASRPDKKQWQGQSAVGGRMYVGKYKFVEDGLEQEIPFESLHAVYRRYVAKFIYRRAESWYDEGYRTFKSRHYRAAKKRCGGDEDWEEMNTQEQHYAAVEEYLIETKYTFQFLPVKFVGYDEALYKKLVSIDAVARSKGEKKHISVDPVELGRNYNYNN